MGQTKSGNTTICKFIRARNPYGMMEGGDHPWLLLDDANTICWCINSSGGIGPDNGVVSQSGCKEGRSCFVPNVPLS